MDLVTSDAHSHTGTSLRGRDYPKCAIVSALSIARLSPHGLLVPTSIGAARRALKAHASQRRTTPPAPRSGVAFSSPPSPMTHMGRVQSLVSTTDSSPRARPPPVAPRTSHPLTALSLTRPAAPIAPPPSRYSHSRCALARRSSTTSPPAARDPRPRRRAAAAARRPRP